MIKNSPPLQIHSIHQRRKVVGRSKNFDQLVAELKTKVREKGAQSLEGGSSTGRSPSPEVSREAPHCRRPLASLPAFRYVSLVVKANITLSVLCSFNVLSGRATFSLLVYISYEDLLKYLC